MATTTSATYNSGSPAFRLAMRRGSVLARIVDGVAVTARRYAPGVGRWLARTGTRIRQIVLYLGGFGSLVYAFFLLSAVLGFVALGVALLMLEALSGPGDGRSR